MLPRRRPWPSGVTGSLLGLALLLPSGHAQEEHDAPLPLHERVIEHRLENRWRFLLLPRGGAPVVSFETRVMAGSAHDPEGLEGLSHLVKNLLFKGSTRIGTRNWPAEQAALEEVDQAQEAWRAANDAGDPQATSAAARRLEQARQRAAELVKSEEFSRILEDAGGGASLNAFTDQDGTRFVVSLPSNQLETWCWMESERFRAPVFREFFVERDALLEDRLGRVEGDALGRCEEELLSTAFADHPLGRPTLGTEASLRRFERNQARELFRARFGARHLVTAIVGDFDPGSLIALLDTYFESVPPGPDRLEELRPVPEPEGERRVRVAFDAEPVVWIAWRVPPKTHPDAAAIEIAVRLLGFARSSRLERRLIRDSGLASELATSPAWGGDHYASLALVRCVPNIGVDPTRVEEAVQEELERLAREGPGQAELAGVRRVATADHIRGLRSNAGLAAGLCDAQVERGDWRAFFTTGQRLRAVTGADVRRVLRTWFVPERRTVATLVPAEEER